MSVVKKTDIKTLYPLIEEIVLRGGSVNLKVSGFSMYPLIANRRDSVVLTKAENIKKGDVLFFKRADGSFILHRVVGIKDGAFSACGDYEQRIEYPIYPEQIVAKAKGFYRKNSYISCDSVLYKFYKLFWTGTFPIRPVMLKLLKIIGNKKQKNAKKNIES